MKEPAAIKKVLENASNLRGPKWLVYDLTKHNNALMIAASIAAEVGGR
jgi:hypothetical protein